jgi:hypothetical protein
VQASRVRDLALLVHIVLNNIRSKTCFIALDHLTNGLDVEEISVDLRSEVCWQLHSLVACLRAAAVDLEFSDGASLSLTDDNYSGNDSVGGGRSILEVASHDVNGIPRAIVNSAFVVNDLLDEEAGVEAWVLSVDEVHARCGCIVVELDVSLEHGVSLLLELKKRLGGEERAVRRRREVLVAPWRAVGVAIAVVLVLQEFFSASIVHGRG